MTEKQELVESAILGALVALALLPLGIWKACELVAAAFRWVFA